MLRCVWDVKQSAALYVCGVYFQTTDVDDAPILELMLTILQRCGDVFCYAMARPEHRRALASISSERCYNHKSG